MLIRHMGFCCECFLKLIMKSPWGKCSSSGMDSRTCMRHWFPLWWRGCCRWLGRTRIRRPCAPACPSRLPPWARGSWLPPSRSFTFQRWFNAVTPRADGNEWSRDAALQLRDALYNSRRTEVKWGCSRAQRNAKVRTCSESSVSHTGPLGKWRSRTPPLSRFPTCSAQHRNIDARLRDRYW